MVEYDWRPEPARKSLNRILPEVEKMFAAELQKAPHEWHKFKIRLHREWERLFIYLHQLYGWQYDFFILFNGFYTRWFNTGWSGLSNLNGWMRNGKPIPTGFCPKK